MIDMHAHWRPAELADALCARTTEPRIIRNAEGVEVLKTRIGQEAREKILHDNAAAMLVPLARIAQREPDAAGTLR